MDFKPVKTPVILTLMDGTQVGTRVVNVQNENLATYFSGGIMYRIHMKHGAKDQGTIVDETPLPVAGLII